MSKFFRYFVKRYHNFKENVLKGNYKEALSIYADAYLKLGEGKKAFDDYWQVYSAAYDGLHRHNSTREKDLRGWIGDEKAFKGFMEYFSTRFGQEGICRVSNKIARKAKPKSKMDKFLHKRQVLDFIKLNIRKGILEKKILFEKTKKYIEVQIVSPNHKEFISWMKDLLSRRITYVKACSATFEGESLQENIRKELNLLLLHNQWVYENIDNVAHHSMEDYLLWHAARYINRKGTGKNIPTNTLTANLKANPLLTVLLTDDKDIKIILKSFRYQKRATYAESENYKILSSELYNIREKDFLDRIRTSQTISGPKTLEESKELIKLRKKYTQNITEYYYRARPVIDFIDKRLGDALKEIFSGQRFERLLPQQREFFESLPNADASTKEACFKVFNRIMGIYTFITRVKLISRRDYHDYYETWMVHDKSKKEKKWVKPLDESLEVFDFPKDADCYIKTVRSCYPTGKYVYVRKKDLVFPTDTNDIYLTRNGYTLARYDCSGNLCKEPLKGNFVKKKIK